MKYSINLSRLSLKAYKDHLLNKDLLPSRRVLLDSIDANISAIADRGIDNIGALIQVVSTPKKLSQLTSISEDYLKILKPEIGSLQTKMLPFFRA